MELNSPTLVYDGDCTFCTSCARQLQRIAPAIEIVPWQHTDLEALGIAPVRAQEAVQWVGADGVVQSGHEAIAAALITAGPLWRIAGRAMLLPGVSWLAALAYRLVADNRSRLSRLFRRLSGST